MNYYIEIKGQGLQHDIVESLRDLADAIESADSDEYMAVERAVKEVSYENTVLHTIEIGEI